MGYGTERRIAELLAGYLDGDRSLKQFLADFARLSWNSHRLGEPQAERLANAIELRLAEFSNGDWTVEQLHEHLRDLLDTHPDTTETEWRFTVSRDLRLTASWTSAHADSEHATVSW